MNAARALCAALWLACAAGAAEPALPDGFGGDPRAATAWRAFEEGLPLRSRELAEDWLREATDAFAPHCLLAQVLRRTEGEPAQALRHAQRCRDAFEARHGAEPGADTPWFWHRLAIWESYAANETLERHADSLRALDALERYHPGMVDAFRGWPLLRLGRIDEARAAAGRALERRANRVQVAKAWTVLCSLEARAGDPHAAYQACRAALETGPNPDDRAVRLVNTAEAARALGRSDEAESLLREATAHFVSGVIASPWLQLVELYVGQARFALALDALREMRSWQARQPASVRVQIGAEHDRAAALFSLAAARPAAAARAAARARAAPDRAGDRSASRAQLALMAALLERASCRAALEQRLEAASYSGIASRVHTWLDALRFAGCAWIAERRAAEALAGEVAYAPGELALPEWLELDAVEIAGAAPMKPGLARARGDARLWRAEIAARSGDFAAALADADALLHELPTSEVLLRARCAVLAGDAALALGEISRAGELFAQALQLDGGSLRRSGSALPVEPGLDPDPTAKRIRSVLLGSPRLRAIPGGLRLLIDSGAAKSRACALDQSGGTLACGEVERRPGESDLELARRLSAAFHARAFAPRIDLAAGLDSLDAATAELPVFDPSLEAEQRVLDQLLR